MKKILLLENKDYRQDNILIDFNKYEIDNILGDNSCNEIIDNFLKDRTVFDEYDTIIIHESIYHDNKREKLFRIIKEVSTNKALIVFSGNCTQFSLQNDKVLHLNPTKLYSNLEVFLKAYKNNNYNILMLELGINWDLNILLNSLEKLNIFIENNTKEIIQKSIFSSKVALSKIKEINLKYYEYILKGIDSNSINCNQIQVIKNNLINLIEGKIDE